MYAPYKEATSNFLHTSHAGDERQQFVATIVNTRIH